MTLGWVGLGRLGACLYKDCFDGYVTNTGDIMIRIVLFRGDVSGQDHRIHANGWQGMVKRCF